MKIWAYMILNKRHVAFLDTNVLYTLVSRDILLWFAYYDLFIPKWSQNIFDEWKNVMLRKGLDEREALRRIDRVNQAFPFALVMGYKPIIQTLDLPDQNDRHVLAAAISSGSNYIVTNNLSDFPSKKLNPYGVQVVSVDDFLEIIIKYEVL